MNITIHITKELRTESGLRSQAYDLDIRDSECLGITGPSGCGKTSLMKMMAGLLSPDTGFITAGGQTWFNKEKKILLPPQKRKCGYLHQNPVLFPFLTLKKNLGFASPDKHKARLYLQALGLERLKDNYPGNLSGGQLKRAALAQLLVAGQPLLLLDEPFASLDADWSRRVIDLLVHYRSEAPRSLVIVSHRQELLHCLSERIITMLPGGRCASGYPNHFTCRKELQPTLYFSRPAG